MSIDNIIQGIPPSKSGIQGDIDQVDYLFNQKTIMRGIALKDNELPMIEARLKQYYQASQVRTWLKEVRDRKKAQNKKKSLSHIDIANQFLTQNKKLDDTLYGRSDYHRYESGVWSIMPELFLKNEIGQLLESLERKEDKEFTSSQQKSILDFIQQKIAVRDKMLDSDDTLINMTNGVFSVDKQKLLPHSPTFYSTTQLPFPYDENAICPTWIYYLRTSLVYQGLFGKWEHDQELIDFLQEAIGYSLTAKMIHHKMFWCIGEGANGKGVLFHILQKLAGTAATPVNIDALNQSFNTYQLAILAGKRIAYCTEVNKSFDFANDAALKAIVAGDSILVRQIRERPFVLESICKVWISMNDFPHIKDTSHGFWRRVCVIPFNRTFEGNEINPDLKEQLEVELPGIFNWAMVGLQRLIANEKFTEPRQVVDLTAKHKLESNTIEMFVQDMCKTTDDTAHTKLLALYAAYKEWSNENGYRIFSRKNFKRELERLGYQEKKITAGLVITKLSLIPKSPLLAS